MVKLYKVSQFSQFWCLTETHTEHEVTLGRQTNVPLKWKNSTLSTTLTAKTPRTTHPWYCRSVFPYALSERRKGTLKSTNWRTVVWTSCYFLFATQTVLDLIIWLTKSSLDILYPCIDFRKEFFEELESTFKPQQRFCGRVPHLCHLRLHLMQHDALQGGETLRIGHHLLLDFLMEKIRRMNSQTKLLCPLVVMVTSRKSTEKLQYPVKYFNW